MLLADSWTFCQDSTLCTDDGCSCRSMIRKHVKLVGATPNRGGIFVSRSLSLVALSRGVETRCSVHRSCSAQAESLPEEAPEVHSGILARTNPSEFGWCGFLLSAG